MLKVDNSSIGRLAVIAIILSLAASYATAEDSPDSVQASSPKAATKPPTEDKKPLPAAPAPAGDKAVSGMSIVGNDEAPKALVIVPWKTSDLGETLDVSRLVDDGRTPVDREVFRRALDYYEIRTGNDR